MADFLISVENLKKKGLIHQNTDTKIIKVAIQRVQDMVIQSATGSPLFRELIDRTNGTTAWTATYRTLMDEYITPALVASVDFKVCLLLSEKITNKGAGRIDDDTMTPLSQSELNHLRDELEKDAMFYLERLIGFLKDDCGEDYPEYTEAITRTNHDLKKLKKGYKTNWIV